MDTIKRILAATDFSQLGNEAVRRAAAAPAINRRADTE